MSQSIKSKELIKELTSFKNLQSRFKKDLPNYDFFQHEGTNCISFMYDEVPYSFDITDNLILVKDIEKELTERFENKLKQFELAIKKVLVQQLSIPWIEQFPLPSSLQTPL